MIPKRDFFFQKKKKQKGFWYKKLKNPSNKGKEANFTKKNILLWFKKRFKSSKSKYRNLEEIKKKKRKTIHLKSKSLFETKIQRKSGLCDIQKSFCNRKTDQKENLFHFYGGLGSNVL